MKNFSSVNTKIIFLVMLLGPLGWFNVGCGTSSPGVLKEVSEVSGTILLPTGGPLKGGTLMLRPFGGVRGVKRLSADINEDGTFIIRPDEKTKIIATNDKVFVGLNDPKFRILKRQVPEKYLDISEDEFETDLFMNLDDQASSIVLKMTKG